MKFTILGYNQTKLIEFGLDAVDALLLRYFVDFKDSGTMVKRLIDGETYYWLKYEGIRKELPILNLKKDSIYRRFKNMAKINMLNHRTIKSGGIYSYYKIGINYLKLLSDSNPIGSDLNPTPYGLQSGSLTDLNPERNINLLKDKSIKDNIYTLVINYLNKKADTRYRATTEKTRQLMNARINEGFNIDDFYKVIDNKVSEWINTDMDRYLRPETLFGTKFEGYLNQKSKEDRKNDEHKQDSGKIQSEGIGFSV